MAASKESLSGKSSESSAERLARFGRNFNVLGAVALGGLAVVVPAGAAVLGTLAGINALQAGGFEVARQVAKSNRTKRLR